MDLNPVNVIICECKSLLFQRAAAETLNALFQSNLDWKKLQLIWNHNMDQNQENSSKVPTLPKDWIKAAADSETTWLSLNTISHLEVHKPKDASGQNQTSAADGWKRLQWT